MAKKQIRGSVLIGYLKFIKKKWGAEGVNQCCETIGMSPKDFKEGAWYDQGYDTKIIDWIAKTKGAEYVEIAGNSAIKNLGIFAYLVRFVSIKTMLKHAPENYKDAYTFGSLKVELGDKSARIIMKDTRVDEYSCTAWLGALRGTLEMTRTKGTVTETQCQGKGAPHCEYLMEWE